MRSIQRINASHALENFQNHRSKTIVPIVGIGTTNPVSLLQVSASNGRSIYMTPGTTSQTINFAESDNGNSNAVYATITGNLNDGSAGHNNGDLSFSTATDAAGNPAPQERMRILGTTGYVGIGTPNPSYPLTLVSSVAQVEHLQSSSSTVALDLLPLGGGGNDWNIISAGAASAWCGSGNLCFSPNPGSSFPMTITPGGLLGIGTETPLAAVHAVAEGSNSALFLTGTTYNMTFSVLPWDGVTYLGSGVSYQNGAWIQQNNSANASSLIGIQPGSGVFWWSETGAGNGGSVSSWNAAGSVQLWTNAGVLVGASSRSVKENFHDLDKADVLGRINNLYISRWKYKSEKDQTHIGPIAEEWYQQFKTGDDDKHIALIDEAGVALAGIQALSQEFTALQSQVADTCPMGASQWASLDARVSQHDRDIASLKTENATMKAWICAQDKSAPFCQ